MDEHLKRPPAEAGMRIGLFGGSFNPAHEGHRLVATQCLHRLGLNRVWMLASPGNPLKSHEELAPLEERVAATRKLVDHPGIEVTGFEAAHGFRYTWETLDYLKSAEPGVRFVWIMGADSLLTLHRWERWETIAETMPMAIYARPGTTFRASRSPAAVALEEFRLPEEEATILADQDPPAWVYLRGVMSGQSSTAIRKTRSSPP
ncbi:MAG TPA: nicotinate-nucleotide adenylyltransferase [Devosia sp.]|jgi:nicotinate-nucleotide adenylyltransferase|nr:nicotinate-nucleotide adenylyltransferase [Devosia sp.]